MDQPNCTHFLVIINCCTPHNTKHGKQARLGAAPEENSVVVARALQLPAAQHHASRARDTVPVQNVHLATPITVVRGVEVTAGADCSRQAEVLKRDSRPGGAEQPPALQHLIGGTVDVEPVPEDCVAITPVVCGRCVADRCPSDWPEAVTLFGVRVWYVCVFWGGGAQQKQQERD